jgi:hypothetical protein
MRISDALQMRRTRDPDRVTCKRCLRGMVALGQIAEGKLRAAGEGVSDG